MPGRKPASRAKPRLETLRERLATEAESLVAAGVQALFSASIGDLIDPVGVASFVRAITEPAKVIPIAKRTLQDRLSRLTASETPLSRRLPRGSEARLRQLVGEPAWFSGAWVREAAANDVLEEVMGTTLYEVPREFTLTVNPFFSSWGLPALLKKAGPLAKLGIFGVSLESGSRLLDSMREEFERQLEPHIKTFLQKSARAALLRAVSLAQSENNLAAFARLRLRVLDDLLSRPGSENRVESRRVEATVESLLGFVSDALTELREHDLEIRFEALRKEREGRTLAMELEQSGLDARAIQEALVLALTPMLRVIMTADPVVEILERLRE